MTHPLRAPEPTMQIIAACDRCGRGYLTLAHEGLRCLANDGGRIWLLPEPEPTDGDQSFDRQRRLKALASRVTENK